MRLSYILVLCTLLAAACGASDTEAGATVAVAPDPTVVALRAADDAVPAAVDCEEQPVLTDPADPLTSPEESAAFSSLDALVGGRSGVAGAFWDTSIARYRLILRYASSDAYEAVGDGWVPGAPPYCIEQPDPTRLSGFERPGIDEIEWNATETQVTVLVALDRGCAQKELEERMTILADYQEDEVILDLRLAPLAGSTTDDCLTPAHSVSFDLPESPGDRRLVSGEVTE